MTEYIYETGLGLNGDIIKRTDSEGNEAYIPTDPANSDYAAYCVWAIAEGLMEAPEVVEPAVVEPEVVTEPDPAP